MEAIINGTENELLEYERIISRNLQSFYEVGKALMAIRDRGLYKLKNGGAYQTFEA